MGEEEINKILNLLGVTKAKDNNMKIIEIKFGWNECITNPSDVIEIKIDNNGKEEVYTIEGMKAEEFIQDIESLIEEYLPISFP